jgi:hypothetical protein
VPRGVHLGRYADNSPQPHVLYGVRDAEGTWLDLDSPTGPMRVARCPLRLSTFKLAVPPDVHA